MGFGLLEQAPGLKDHRRPEAWGWVSSSASPEEETTLRPPLGVDSAQQSCRTETNSKLRPQWIPEGSSASLARASRDACGGQADHTDSAISVPVHRADAGSLRSTYSAAGRQTPDQRPQPGAGGRNGWENSARERAWAPCGELGGVLPERGRPSQLGVISMRLVPGDPNSTFAKMLGA